MTFMRTSNSVVDERWCLLVTYTLLMVIVHDTRTPRGRKTKPTNPSPWWRKEILACARTPGRSHEISRQSFQSLSFWMTWMYWKQTTLKRERSRWNIQVLFVMLWMDQAIGGAFAIFRTQTSSPKFEHSQNNVKNISWWNFVCSPICTDTKPLFLYLPHRSVSLDWFCICYNVPALTHEHSPTSKYYCLKSAVFATFVHCAQ